MFYRGCSLRGFCIQQTFHMHPQKATAHNRWEMEPFREVTVMASRANPLPTGTSWRMSCAGEAKKSFPACTVTIGKEAWEDSLGKWIRLTDQLSRWA